MKKIKKISVRLSQEDYKYLKDEYLWTQVFNPNKHKTFSDYIRYLLDLGVEEYY